MGGTESTDKQKDMTVSDHIADMFRESPYKVGSYPFSTKDSYRYGEADFLEMAYDKVAIRKRIRVKDDRQFTVFVKNKAQRMQFEENLFVRMLDYDCGSMPEEQTEDGQYKYYIDVYFDFHENDLRNEIERRRSSGHYFSSEELSKLVEFFIKAGTFLDTSDNRHGDLRPEYICITEEGRFLLQENVRDKPGTGPRLAYMSSIDLYCSPAMYKGFCKNVMKVKRDKAKDDVFSAGMILLEAGLLEHPSDIYNQELGKIDQEALNARFERFEESYGSDSELCDNVRKFLVVDEIDRSYFKEIATAKKPTTQNQNRIQHQANTHAGYGNQVNSSPGYGNQGSANQGYTAGYGSNQDGYKTTAVTGNSYGVSNGYQYGQQQTSTSYGGYAQPTAVSGGYSYGHQYDNSNRFATSNPLQSTWNR
jgi:hypothetical protein